MENNSLAHALAAIEANKPGTVESWTKEQQEQIREACSGGTPVNGSDLVAGHDMTLAGKDVRIVAATQSSSQTHTVEQKSSGLTLALSGSALDSAVRTTTRASEADSGRLATIAAGIAGGLAGDGTAAAVAGAQSGKGVVENNLFGGTELEHGKKAREHGKDVLSCADNPSGEACQRGLAENKAYAGALATGGVALLPGTAQAMWGLGAGVNAGAQYAEDGKVNPVNSVIAGWINVASIGNGLWGTVGWNAAGGALDNPLTGAITNGLGSAGGYWGGKLISSGTNAAGKWLTGGWDPKFNPDLLKYTEIKGQLRISKEMLPGKLPGNMGNIGASVISEGGGKGAEQVIKKIGEKNEK